MLAGLLWRGSLVFCYSECVLIRRRFVDPFMIPNLSESFGRVPYFVALVFPFHQIKLMAVNLILQSAQSMELPADIRRQSTIQTEKRKSVKISEEVATCPSSSQHQYSKTQKNSSLSVDNSDLKNDNDSKLNTSDCDNSIWSSSNSNEKPTRTSNGSSTHFGSNDSRNNIFTSTPKKSASSPTALQHRKDYLMKKVRTIKK